MRRCMMLLTGTCCVFMGASARAQDCVDLYNPDQVLNYYITMVNPGDWTALVNSCGAPAGLPDGICSAEESTDPWLYWPALFQCESSTPIYVGVRRKNDRGEPSELNPQKVSLKIDINVFLPEQSFANKTKMSFENGSEDCLVTEGFSWRLYRTAGAVAGRVAWIHLYVDAADGLGFVDKGLYANVEAINKNFFDDRGIDDSGFLYKVEERRTRELDVNPFCFNWSPFDHPDRADCGRPVAQPADWRDQARWRVDIPQLLKMAGAENYVANQDAAVQKMTNYWYYDWSILPGDNPAGHQPRLYLPWDLDTCLADGNTAYPVNGVGTGHLRVGILQDAVFGPEYQDTYRALLNGPLALSKMLATASKTQSVIGAYMDADPYQDTGTSTEEFQLLRTYLKNRSASLLAQLGLCTNGVCDPGEDACTCPGDCGAPETTETVCTDGKDNDCDTLVDCYDSDCGAHPMCSCWDVDGDGYGEGACLGPDCDDSNPDVHPGAAEVCSDGLDNDCNGWTDCPDAACNAQPGCDTSLLLNEYNAVDADQYLEGGAYDPAFGPTPVLGNGGDWFELVVVQDHLDVRGWQLVLTNAPTDPVFYVTRTLTFTSDPIWSNLRSGTIITVSEDQPDDLSYDPCAGDWTINVQANDLASGTYITAHSFTVTNRNWRMKIIDNLGTVRFGPAGEGINPVSGVGGDEVCKLEQNPSTTINSFSSYNDGSSSTFGAPNQWNAGTIAQDFSALRAVVNCHARVDFEPNGRVDTADFDVFTACRTGAGVQYNPTSPPAGCTASNLNAADVDGDGDVDHDDYGSFQRCYSGSGSADPDCAN